MANPIRDQLRTSHNHLRVFETSRFASHFTSANPDACQLRWLMVKTRGVDVTVPPGFTTLVVFRSPRQDVDPPPNETQQQCYCLITALLAPPNRSTPQKDMDIFSHV